MFLVEQNAGPCRVAKVPVCESKQDAAQSAPVLAIGEFQISKRDTLDFSVDLSAWLVANGGAQLTDATWAKATDSPKAPTIGDSVFSPQGMATVIVSAADDAEAGDAYWLDVTFAIAATTAVNPGEVAIPAREMTRRIYIVVVNG